MVGSSTGGAGARRRLLPALGAVLVGTLLVQVAPPGGPATASAESVASARAEAARLSAELDDLRDQSDAAIVALEQAEDELGSAVGRSAVLARELDAARELAGGTDRQLQRRVSALYRSGGSIGVWVSLLDAKTPAELAARKANVDKVVAVDAQRRDASALGASRVAELEEQARQAASDAIAATGLAEARAAELNELMTRQSSALEAASQRVRDLVEADRRAAAAAAAAELARQSASRASAELAAAEAAARARAAATGQPYVPPVGVGAPAFVGPLGACPVGPAHSFTDTWHAPRSGGRKHQGTDVFAPYGSPAYAVLDGVIERWSDGGLGGIALWLRADDGSRYYYAHNAANVAQPGTRVRAGQLIAYVGTTGNAATTPPHIHFEAHPPQGGGARNPYPWLAALCGR